MRRLLVVDDSPTIRKLVELAFRGADWQLDFAATGQDGIARARTFAPDVVLLDFVLPDMRGVDVCARLAADEATRALPIVVMSAKDDLREILAPYASVADVLAKPFSGEALVARLVTVVERRPATTRPKVGRFTRAQTEAAATALFARMKKALAFIPSWCAQMGASSPAPFFARKLLTPELVGDLLDAIVPIVERSVSSAADLAEGDEGHAIAGSLRRWPVADLLTLIGASARTGALTLSRGGGHADVVVYFDAGEIVFVTSHDPSAAFADRALAEIERDVRASAERVQRESGKPALVTLAERGALPASIDLAQALHELGRKTLLETLDVASQRFVFAAGVLPEYVAAYGRHVSMARRTLMFPAPGRADEDHAPAQSLGDLSLERARHESREGVAWPAADVVFDRAQGFSQKVRSLRFDAGERRVLALVGGRWDLRLIAARAGVPLDEARRIAWTFLELGLVAAVEGAADSRPVLILEPDAAFRAPLESLLARRAEPLALVSVDRDGDLIAAARRARPSLVIVNAEATAGDPRDALAEMRSDRALAAVPCVAVLDLGAAARAPELEAAGFDAVLVKPVAFAELERLIRSA